MPTRTAGGLLSPVGAPSTRATEGRVRRYLCGSFHLLAAAHEATMPP
jgi:hypothetical protein